MFAAALFSVLDILTEDLMSNADTVFHTAVAWEVRFFTRTMVRLRHDS